MVDGSEMRMRSDMKNLEEGMMMRRGENVNLGDNLQGELELLLRGGQQRYNGNPIYEEDGEERDQNIHHRSGSAPPTVEGSFMAVGSLFGGNSNFELGDTSNIANADAFLSEEELRSHPAYLAYYYSNENLNPRLPPPLLSREDWRVAQRFQAGGGSSFCDFSEWKKMNAAVHMGGGTSSLFSMQPGSTIQSADEELMELIRAATPHNLSRQPSTEWLDRGSDGLIGISGGVGLGVRRKSFADILQEGLENPKSFPNRLSRPASHNSFSDMVASTTISRCPSAEFIQRVDSMGSFQSMNAKRGIPRARSIASGVCQIYSSSAAATTRSPSPSPHYFSNGVHTVEKKNIMGSKGIPRPSSMTKLAEFSSSMSNLGSLRNQQLGHDDSLLQSQRHMGLHKPGELRDKFTGGNQMHLPQVEKSKVETLASTTTTYAGLPKKNARVINCNGPNKLSPSLQIPSPNLASKMDPPGFTSVVEGSHIYRKAQNIIGTDFSAYKQPDGACAISNQANVAASNHLDKGSTVAGAKGAQNVRSRQEAGPHHHLQDPLYIKYLQKMNNGAYDATSSTNNYPPQENNLLCAAQAHVELLALQKAYLETLLAQQTSQFEAQLLHNFGGLNGGYFLNPPFGICTPFQGHPMVKPVFLSGGSESPMLHDEHNSRYNSMGRSAKGESAGTWQSARNNKEAAATSLLEELKSNKTKSFELSDIVGHVVEFSTDQYGSRFIQQKLETSAMEEKKKIFPEVIQHARTLMTDVFGNYVIQKYFEHGTENQKKELVSQLSGHVLPLSLQMYGCRVIQKALELVDVEQQSKIVGELDGFVIKCVRDQNGNHVIQKCIECVPQDRIQFIISAFSGQVVQLSSHPYGCRVIQRVLEHCDGPKMVKLIMNEIMKSVCTLAQDQYGNYVIQHVLQRGRPRERANVIRKLAGQIVKMSQQKFASNVVEKCLTYGGTEERQLLVNEMLGTTDDNEPLQAMMKDPYGNYVVQKVLETCSDQNRELILSRIKVHLTSIKKYTYGKHIVSRVEKLVSVGERRRGLAYVRET